MLGPRQEVQPALFYEFSLEDHVPQDQGNDLRRHAAARAPYGLALSPPFAPWPERWTLTMEPSIIAYSKSASAAKALNML